MRTQTIYVLETEGQDTTQLPEMLKRSIKSREPGNRNSKRKLGNTARFTDKKMNNKESQ